MSDKCTGTNVQGKPCGSYAMAGHTLCAAHLGRVGRKSMLSPELQAQFLQMLRAGNYIEIATRAVGISRQTFYEWMERGKSDAPDDAQYRELREAVAVARAEGEVRAVAHIASAARENWQAAAWLLERQYPDRWGRASVRTRDEAPPQPEPSEDTTDAFSEVDELADARRRRHARA